MPNSGGSVPPAAPAAPAESPLSRAERRLTRRVSIAGALIDLEVLEGEHRLRMPVFALDLNADGLALQLPSEVPVGVRVAMTFQLSADFRLVGVEGRVIYNRGDRSGVRWVGWEEDERLRLLEYLDKRYHETTDSAEVQR